MFDYWHAAVFKADFSSKFFVQNLESKYCHFKNDFYLPEAHRQICPTKTSLTSPEPPLVRPITFSSSLMSSKDFVNRRCVGYIVYYPVTVYLSV